MRLAVVTEATRAATNPLQVNSFPAAVSTFSCFVIGNVPRYKSMSSAPILSFHACMSIVLVMK